MPNIEELSVRFTADTSSFTRGAASVETRLAAIEALANSCATAVTALDASLAAAGVSFGAAAGMATAFGVELRALQRSAQSLNASLNSGAPTSYGTKLSGAATEATTMATQVAALRAQVIQLNAAMSQTRALASAQTALPGAGGGGGAGRGVARGAFGSEAAYAMGRTGSVMQMGGAALVGLSAISAKAGMDFEAAMAKLEAYAGATHAEVKALIPEVLKLSNATGISAVHAAEALYYIEGMGIHGRPAIELLTTSMKASASGLGAVKDVAQATLSIMQAYGPAAYKASQVMDMIGKAAVISHRDPSEIFKSIGQVLPIVSALHIKLNDVLATWSILTREGMNSPMAFNAIRQMMYSLAAPTKKQLGAMKALGIDPGELRKEMQDNLYEALKGVEQKGHGVLTKLLDVTGARRGAQALLSVVNPDSEKQNKKAFADMGKTAGTAGHAFEVAAQTAKFAWGQAFEATRNAAIEWGQSLRNESISVANHIRMAAEWYQKLPPALKHVVAETTLTAGATMLLGGTLLKLMPAIQGVAVMFKTLGPAGMGAMALILGAVVLDVAMFKSNFAGFRDHVKSCLKAIQGTWQEVWPKLVYIVQQIGPPIMEVFKALTEEGLHYLRTLLEVFLWFVRTVTDLWMGAATTWDTLFGNGMDGIKSLATAMAAFVIGQVAHMVNTTIGLLDKLISFASTVGATVTGVAIQMPTLGSTGLGSYFQSLESGSNILAATAMQNFADRRNKVLLNAVKTMAKAGAAPDLSDPLAAFNQSPKGGGGKGFDVQSPGGGGGKGKRGKESEAEREHDQQLESINQKLHEFAKAQRQAGDESEYGALKAEILTGEYDRLVPRAYMLAKAAHKSDEALLKLTGSTLQGALAAAKIHDQWKQNQELQKAVTDSSLEMMKAMHLDPKDQAALEQFKKLYSDISDKAHKAAVDAIVANNQMAEFAKAGQGAFDRDHEKLDIRGSYDHWKKMVDERDQPLKDLLKDLDELRSQAASAAMEVDRAWGTMEQHRKRLTGAQAGQSFKPQDDFKKFMESFPGAQEFLGAAQGVYGWLAAFQKLVKFYKDNKSIIDGSEYLKNYSERVLNAQEETKRLLDSMRPLTDAQRIDRTAFRWIVNADGQIEKIRVMTDEQAKQVVLQDKYNERLARMIEMVKSYASVLSDAVGKMGEEALQHGLKGIFRTGLKSVSDSIHSMVIQSMKDSVQHWATGTLGKLFHLKTAATPLDKNTQALKDLNDTLTGRSGGGCFGGGFPGFPGFPGDPRGGGSGGGTGGIWGILGALLSGGKGGGGGPAQSYVFGSHGLGGGGHAPAMNAGGGHVYIQNHVHIGGGAQVNGGVIQELHRTIGTATHEALKQHEAQKVAAARHGGSR